MKMKELFDRGEFVVSAEVGPPKGIHVDELVEEAKTYLKDVHAVNVTDNQSSVMRLGSLAMCKVLKDAGMNPIFQLACRDRNIMCRQDCPRICSLVISREVFFVSEGHRKPETYRANLCD